MSAELVGVFQTDQGLIWNANHSADLLGFEVEVPLGEALEQLVHPDDVASVRLCLAQGSGTAEAIRFEARGKRSDGEWAWLEWSVSRDDVPGLTYAMARDVTEDHNAWETLRDGERLIQAIIDQSSAAIFVRDHDNRYVLVNKTFCDNLDMADQEILGQTPAEIWGERTSAQIKVDATVLAGNSITSEDTIVISDRQHVVLSTRFPLIDDNGAVSGQIGIATDITDRTMSEQVLGERERLLDTIVRACPDIVTMLDPTGRVQQVSDASARILGYDIDQPVHEELEALIHPDDIDSVYEEYGKLMSMQNMNLDMRYRVRHRLGHWVTLHTLGQAVAGVDGRAEGAVVISRDITEDLAFEQDLEAAVSTAEAASTAKSAFLSRMSHELRTPLNSVIGFGQLLELDPLDEQQAEAVGHIIRAGKHLLELTDEVLDIARIESGHPEVVIDSVLLASVIGDAVDLSRPLAEERDVRLSVDLQGCPVSAYVRADRQRLMQVLLNLLSNGVKYNHPGGTIEVAVRRSTRKTKVSVHDSGPGIDTADVHRVFQPFDRLGAEHSGVEGTGMGLSVSKQLAEEMEATIELESVVGEGTTFTIVLPTGTAPKANNTTEVPNRVRNAAPGKVRVLHVEDNVANLELVEQVMARAQGVELFAAMYGSLGVEMAREYCPDLVLLDLGLPDMTGAEVLEQLRSNPTTAGIPVVVVSADATPDQIRRLKHNGAKAYLTKPIDVADLLHIVELVASGTEPWPS